MKLSKIFIIVVAASVFFALGAGVTFAQEKMTKDEWQQQMTEYTAKRNDLKAQLQQLTKEIDDLKAQSTQKDADLKKCEDEILALVGATQADVDAFAARVDALEAKVNELSRLSNEELLARKAEIESAQSELNELRKSKISLLPRFYDRLQAIQQKIDGLRNTLASMEKFYTVGTWAKNRDCLWNISKKKDIYDNPFMWPKIWQGNRELIKDPDLIYPGWRLRIPQPGPLSADEKKAEARYWRLKHARAEKMEKAGEKPAAEKPAMK